MMRINYGVPNKGDPKAGKKTNQEYKYDSKGNKELKVGMVFNKKKFKLGFSSFYENFEYYIFGIVIWI